MKLTEEGRRLLLEYLIVSLDSISVSQDNVENPETFAGLQKPFDGYAVYYSVEVPEINGVLFYSGTIPICYFNDQRIQPNPAVVIMLA